MSKSKPRWEDPFSPMGMRSATAKILTGMNYRVFYEDTTRRKLISTYQELTALAKEHPKDDDMWRESIRQLLSKTGRKKEEQDLRRWLIGMTKKTADNMGLSQSEYPAVFDQVMSDIDEYSSEAESRDTALLLWAGAATLTIRGSSKSKIGKILEKSIARASLTIIGLSEADGDFRLNVGADEEVARETDAEIRTPRGYVRMEVGMIGRGNPEVIGDKITRMDRNGVVIFDTLSESSAMWGTAQQRGVQLIQLRNNHPVEELRQHLQALNVAVREDPISPEDVEILVMALPDDLFEKGA